MRAQEVPLPEPSGKGSKGCICRSRRADKRHAGLTTQRSNTWRRVQGSAAAAAKPRFRGGRSLFPTRTPPVARPRVHLVRRHPCPELSPTRPALPCPALLCGLFSGKAPESELAIGGFVPEKKGCRQYAATPDTEVQEISGNELRRELSF